MSRVDKTEDHVQKLFRDYQDNWSKYAEGHEKGADNIKVYHVYVHTCVCVVLIACVSNMQIVYTHFHEE